MAQYQRSGIIPTCQRETALCFRTGLFTVLPVPAPAKFLRLAREFRHLVEEPCHFRPAVFRDRKTDFREYHLLAIEVGEAWRRRFQLLDRVSQPYPSYDSRGVAEHNGAVRKHLLDPALFVLCEPRQLVGEHAFGPCWAFAEDAQHRLRRFMREVQYRSGQMMTAIDGQDAHREPIPFDRALRAEPLIHLDRLSTPDYVAGFRPDAAGKKILKCAPLNRTVVMLAEQLRQLALVYPGLCAERLKVF